MSAREIGKDELEGMIWWGRSLERDACASDFRRRPSCPCSHARIVHNRYPQPPSVRRSVRCSVCPSNPHQRRRVYYNLIPRALGTTSLWCTYTCHLQTKGFLFRSKFSSVLTDCWLVNRLELNGGWSRYDDMDDENSLAISFEEEKMYWAGCLWKSIMRILTFIIYEIKNWVKELIH